MAARTRTRFGPLLRTLRTQRGLTQARLAERADVSPRHLSCLETGRAAPSRQMVLHVGGALDLPLRERNRLLAAAGFAAAFAETADSAAYSAGPLRTLLRRLLRAQDPFPAVALDREWNVVDLNATAGALFGWLSEGLTAPTPG